MLIVHHLKVSQSERIVWLLEELDLPYELRVYQRDPVTQFAPPELRSVHPLGSAPVLCDREIVMAESGAIAEYVLARYGNGRLAVPVTSPQYPDYLYWFHYANASLMMQIGVNWIAAMAAGQDSDSPLLPTLRERLDLHLQLVEDRLSRSPYFAGSEFTAADIMMHFPFGTMKAFYNIGLDNRPNIKAWLARISDRPGYQHAMKAAGHEQDPALDWGATRGAF
ncbi:glutathione S-transferase family protein [Microcoleus sp. FACHB-831]|uniref:glutathione S-transferase family protein n=1 Tax=Microcoleus sp. FACHB-831 TaxID=2692827 RepID=UPI0016825CD6|nr:glutathione S-transferase family protein [Microcoleus sp. FACHB-831]MBD1919640.1 glutathione S-transferase family protein [Microcoleus sp. FACHB-831]